MDFVLLFRFNHISPFSEHVKRREFLSIVLVGFRLNSVQDLFNGLDLGFVQVSPINFCNVAELLQSLVLLAILGLPPKKERVKFIFLRLVTM